MQVFIGVDKQSKPHNITTSATRQACETTCKALYQNELKPVTFIDVNTIGTRLQEFINARSTNINNQRYLPLDDNTIHQFILELVQTDEDYYETDDFRSRA